jgi:hypothetical protein
MDLRVLFAALEVATGTVIGSSHRATARSTSRDSWPSSTAKASQAVASRCRVVLACAEGLTNVEDAERLEEP